MRDLHNPESASDYYFHGIRALYRNARVSALKYFGKAKELGFADTERVDHHIANLESRIQGRRRASTRAFPDDG